MNQKMPEDSFSTMQPMGLLLRLFWMIAGNAILFFLVVHFVTEKPGQLTQMDIVYWVTAAALIGARLLDITRFGGLTSEGEPATLAQGVRYSVVVAALASVVWVGVHVGIGTFAASGA